jgi:hypothetical protein
LTFRASVVKPDARPAGRGGSLDVCSTGENSHPQKTEWTEWGPNASLITLRKAEKKELIQLFSSFPDFLSNKSSSRL